MWGPTPCCRISLSTGAASDEVVSMARIAYDERDAAAFEANRHVDDDGLTGWREAVARHLDPHPGLRLLDPGSVLKSGRVTLFRFFPEAAGVVDSYPSVADGEAAFRGFTTAALEPVVQVTAASLRDAAAGLRRAAHTPLQLITDEEYAAGLARLRAAAAVASGPVTDVLDLLVLKAA